MHRLAWNRKTNILSQILVREVLIRRRYALRDGARNFRQMSPRQREQMRRSMHAVRALPPDQQARLRQLWRSMTPQQRREWLARGGPGIAPPP